MAGESGTFIGLIVTSNVNEFRTERRFPSDINLANLKGKLELLTGVVTESMRLELRSGELVLQHLTDDTLTLAEIGLRDGMNIHVVDKDDKERDDEDDKDVAFQLSSEEYAQREDSMRKFLEKNKLGRFDDEKAKKKAEDELKEEELAESLKVGDRVEVRTAGNPVRRGQLKYVGKVHFKPGAWVGVQYDEPMGKNDGSVEGKKYFDCKPKYGSFVRPSNVTVGDFPEVNDLDEI